MAAPKDEPKIYTGIVLDFETGDLDPTTGACTQIALQAVRLDTWEVIDKYVSYIKPYHRKDISGKQRKKVLKNKREAEIEEAQELMTYSEKALTYSAITMKMLETKGKDIEQVANDVIAFAEKNTLSKAKDTKPILIGQNIDFDKGFLQQLMAYTGKLKNLLNFLQELRTFGETSNPTALIQLI